MLHASDLTDFRIPEHRWYTLVGGVSGRWDSDRSEGPASSSLRRDLRGSLNAMGRWSLDADDRWITLGLNANVGGQRLRSEYLQIYMPEAGRFEERNEVEVLQESWGADAEMRRYFLPVPLGIIVRGEAAANHQQQWRNDVDQFTIVDSTTLRLELSSEIWLSTYQLSATGSVGWGKVRDATGVYDAQVLEQRLIRLGVLGAPLSRAVRHKLADLYYLRSRFSVVHARPDRFFWNEVERVLMEDEAFSERDWRAFEIMRANEPYQFRRQRRAGYFIGPSIQATAQHQKSLTHSAIRNFVVMNDSLVSDTHLVDDRNARRKIDVVQLGAQAELHLPLGWRWQIDLESVGRTPSRDFARDFNVTSSATTAYFVADRWALDGFLQHQHVRYGSRGSVSRIDGWNLAFGASLAFRAEDRLTITLQAVDQQNHVITPPESRHGRDRSISLGMSYRFLGGLDAPGLMEPVRSLPLGDEERSW